jgi:hypothetical protein
VFERCSAQKRPRSSLLSDYDSAWKEALESFFEEFISFFFPEAHSGIDWSLGYEFLDKELQKVVRDAELGRIFHESGSFMNKASGVQL